MQKLKCSFNNCYIYAYNIFKEEALPGNTYCQYRRYNLQYEILNLGKDVKNFFPRCEFEIGTGKTDSYNCSRVNITPQKNKDCIKMVLNQRNHFH